MQNLEQPLEQELLAANDSSIAIRELTMEELTIVAGGPQITNDGAVPH